MTCRCCCAFLSSRWALPTCLHSAQIGYAAFGEDTKDIITLNLPADWSTTLVKVGSLRKQVNFASDACVDMCSPATPRAVPCAAQNEGAGVQLLRAGIGAKINLMTVTTATSPCLDQGCCLCRCCCV